MCVYLTVIFVMLIGVLIKYNVLVNKGTFLYIYKMLLIYN